jgi:hypothetical protein
MCSSRHFEEDNSTATMRIVQSDENRYKEMSSYEVARDGNHAEDEGNRRTQARRQQVGDEERQVVINVKQYSLV